MDNSIINNANNHEVKLRDRKNIYLSGVIKIDSFDDEEFLIETNMGHLVIKGEGLEVIKLDTHDGDISIKGLIIGLNYIDSVKTKKIGIFDKLFK